MHSNSFLAANGIFFIDLHNTEKSKVMINLWSIVVEECGGASPKLFQVRVFFSKHQLSPRTYLFALNRKIFFTKSSIPTSTIIAQSIRAKEHEKISKILGG